MIGVVCDIETCMVRFIMHAKLGSILIQLVSGCLG